MARTRFLVVAAIAVLVLATPALAARELKQIGGLLGTVSGVVSSVPVVGTTANGILGTATLPLGSLTGSLTNGNPLGAVTGLTGGLTSPLGTVTGLTGGLTSPLGTVTSLTGGLTSPLGAVTGLTGGLTSGSPLGAVTGLVAGLPVVGGVVGPVTSVVGGAAGGVVG